MHRLPVNAPAKQAYHEATAKKVKKVRGGQRTTWISTMRKDFKYIDKAITIEKATEKAQNRETYAQMVNGAMERSLAETR